MTRGHDLAMALRAAYLAMHRATDAALAEHGVTADQFVLLTALSLGDGHTQRDLARRVSSDPNTVRAMLLLLEKQGLVARPAHPTDARARTVALTPRGRRVYRKLWAASEATRQRLTAQFEADEVETLLQLLGRLSTSIGRSANQATP